MLHKHPYFHKCIKTHTLKINLCTTHHEKEITHKPNLLFQNAISKIGDNWSLCITVSTAYYNSTDINMLIVTSRQFLWCKWLPDNMPYDNSYQTLDPSWAMGYFCVSEVCWKPGTTVHIIIKQHLLFGHVLLFPFA